MASLKEIAKEADVAEATVSRILRNRDQCSPATRARVLELARRHKYRPNMLVRGMQTGRTQTIGVMLPLASEFFGRIFAGIHDALVRADHVPIVLWAHDDLSKADRRAELPELQQIHRLIDRRVDGVILRPVDDAVSDEYLHEIWDRNIPLVAVDRELQHSRVDFVGVDDVAVGRLAGRHLLELGHRRLGQLAGPAKVTTSRLRREGFEAIAREAGASVVTEVDPTFGDAFDAALRLLDRAERPTAVFAANDVLAAQVCQAARRLSLAIPGDLSVMGCGGLDLRALLQPRLTTILQHPEAIGREAVRLLMARLDDGDALDGPQATRLPPQLELGDSTASPDREERSP